MKEFYGNEDSSAFSTSHLSNIKDKGSEDVFLQYSLATEIETSPLLMKMLTHGEYGPKLNTPTVPHDTQTNCFNVAAQDDEYSDNTLSQYSSAAQVCLALSMD